MNARAEDMSPVEQAIVTEILEPGEQSMKLRGDGRDWARRILERDAFNVRHRLTRQSPTAWVWKSKNNNREGKTMSSQYGNRQSVREQFEQMLKESNYFADVINTHRRATAEVMADVIGLMMDSGGLDQAKVLAALKSMGEGSTPGKPSLGSAKRLVAVLVMDALQARGAK